MENTLEILGSYLERAAENLSTVNIFGHLFPEEAKSKRKRTYEKQIQMSGFPIKKALGDFGFPSASPSSPLLTSGRDELAAMRFPESGENEVFLGPPGVGKTRLAPPWA